ncbi:MAG: DsbA family protein [Anaerolineales bacterium]|nr:DsbA family protein [Anaerolineales bacterium]MCX7755001.1 DsbA family protein [Anaerolineales bacterium]MDW8278786.1 thioredoxin domain-containing protein [Anaerolineales bacterium]
MSKRQELRERRAKQKRTQRILLIGGGLLVVAAIALFFILSANQSVGEIAQPEPINRPNVNFNAMGDPNAPVKMVVYSNFLCGHCADFAFGSEKKLIEDYIASGKLYLEYRSIGGGDSLAGRTAEAAYCAGDQGKFWEMHDYLFANLKYANFSDARIFAFANRIGLNAAQFKDCYNNRKHAATVQQDAVRANQDGVQATPTFILSNGDVITGNMPYTEFQTKIEAALASAGQ